MDLLIKDLQPGQPYALQVRAKNGAQTSEWSTVFNFTAQTDGTAPAAITGLTWSASGTSFLGSWTKPTLNSDGSPLKDFRDYKIVLTASSISATYYVSQEKFDFTFAMNLGSFGSAKASVQISVQARDTSGNLSTAVTATASHSAPATPTNFVASTAANAVQATWDASSESAFANFQLYLSTTSGFTPGPTNLVYSGSGTNFIYSTSTNTTYYMQLRQVDVFGQGSGYASSSAVPSFPTNIDTSAPAATSSVTTTSAVASDGTANITVSWSSVASANLRNYVVRYSTDQITWTYITVPSSATSTIIPRLLPATAYYIGVASVSYYGIYSSYTNSSTYPITTVADTTPPSQPSAPTISINTMAAQVSHAMTKAAGGNLEADTAYLEVHASTTTGFTPSSTTLIGTLQSGGQGIPVSAVFDSPVTNSYTNMFWKVIAVDNAKNKSTASSQATGLPGLIQGINIASATITDANINDLTASKITAGTGFINNLTVNSTFIVGSSGHMQSSNYSVPSQTGWTLDTAGLTIYNGTIAAAVLQLQDSNNICSVAYSDFEFSSSFYHNSSNAVNTLNGSADAGVSLAIQNTGVNTGAQCLRVYNAALAFGSFTKYYFAPGGASTTGLNVVVNPGTYIYSIYAKKNGTPDQTVKMGIYLDNSTSTELTGFTPTTTWTRYSGTFTVPSGVQKLKLFLDLGPNSGSTGYDVLIDTVMFERQIAGINTPSPWTPPSATAIDGGSIVTGSIASSAPSATISGQPAWSINTTGGAQFGDVLVRGSIIVGSGAETASYVQSGNFVTGTSGWHIAGDGNVEFNSGTFRGNLAIGGSANSTITLNNASNLQVGYWGYDKFFITNPANQSKITIVPNTAISGGMSVLLNANAATALSTPATIWATEDVNGSGINQLVLESGQYVNASSRTVIAYVGLEANYAALGIGSTTGGQDGGTIVAADTYAKLGFFTNNVENTSIFVGSDLIRTNGTIIANNEAWNNFTIASGWAGVAGYYQPQYRKMPDGTIMLRGRITIGSVTFTSGSQQPLSVLPVGYRPTGTIQHITASIVDAAPTFLRPQVDNTGTIIVNGLPTSGTHSATIGFDGIRFDGVF